MLELRLLGPHTLLKRDGIEVRSVLHQPKRLALLCYLSIAAPGSYVRREELLALLWPDSRDKQARSSLSEALSRLRHSLGPGIIITRGNDEVGVAKEALWCDVIAFVEAARREDSEQAAELYRGDLMETFSLANGARFNRWLRTERERLKRLATDVISHLADQASSTGDDRALEWAERALALAPFDDSAARRLMDLRERRGHRTSALELYEAFRRRLDEEGLQPSPETIDLMRRIRAGGPEAGRADFAFRRRRVSGETMRLLTVLAVLIATMVISSHEPAAVESPAVTESGTVPIQPPPDPLFTLMVDFQLFLGPDRATSEPIEGFLTRRRPDATSVGSGVTLTEVDEGEGPDCWTNRRLILTVDENPAALDGTWLERHSDLTLVLPCDPWDADDRQPVVGEYLAYAAYSAFADVSLEAQLTGVRLVNSQWIEDSAPTQPDSVTTLALVIESPRVLAQRYGGELFDRSRVHPSRLTPHASTLVELFEYMIGNTQFSMPSLYNVFVVERDGDLIPVPHGFRYAGIVDPTTPAPEMLPIDSAGERLYRGFCRKTGYGAALDVLRGARDDIYGLYMSQPRLDARRRANALSWLNELFDQIAVPGDAERFLAETCRSLG